VLESAQPGDGAVVAQSPAEVSLRFNEAVSPVFARVLGADGQVVTSPADASAENNRLTIKLNRPLPPGTYTIAIVATPPSALADGVLGPSDILALGARDLTN